MELFRWHIAKRLVPVCGGAILLYLLSVNFIKEGDQRLIAGETIRHESPNTHVEKREYGSLNDTHVETSKYERTNDTYVGECQRQHISVSPEECKKHEVSELKDERTFPTHHVSGAPGSGNDWILWLGSLTRYSWTKFRLHQNCEVYAREENIKLAHTRRTTTCLFLKSHEPWFHETWGFYSTRTVLLLRHPYDAMFAEYKRMLAVKAGVNVNTEEMKSSTVGQTVKEFYDVSTNSTSTGWKQKLTNYIPKWLKHAKYWLTEYTRPLHVLIYNRVRESPIEEIEKMQAFFGYKFDGANFRRHCCMELDASNKKLKRRPGPVDKYRNYALEQEVEIRRKYEKAVSKVHDMLDKKFPNTKYRITRG